MYFIRDTAMTVLPELLPGLVQIWTEVCLLLFTQITTCSCVPLGFLALCYWTVRKSCHFSVDDSVFSA